MSSIRYYTIRNYKISIIKLNFKKDISFNMF
nr:MAG TPA: hypothetical protein [Caudoviricetes sp.]